MLTPEQEGGWQNLGAWSKYAECSSPNPLYSGPWSTAVIAAGVNNVTIAANANGCVAGQAQWSPVFYGDPWGPLATPTYNYARSVGIGRTLEVAPGVYRVQIQEGYTRPSSGAFTPPTWQDAKPPAALPAPSAHPDMWVGTAFPDEFPPMALPAFTPPVPWRLLPDFVSPFRQVGPEPQPKQSPSMSVNDWSVSIVSPSAGAGGFGRPPKYHQQVAPSEMPRRPERERKLRLNRTMALAVKVVNQATEAVDIVDAIYQALPRQYRPRYGATRYERRRVTPQDKLRALYEHYDKINIEQAVANLVGNHLEDAMYGSLGRVGASASIQAGLQSGMGLNTLQRRFGNWAYEAQKKDIDTNF